MATNNYIGPQGGNWFDPANWSNGVVPAAGDTATVIGELGSSMPDGPDATAGIVAGVTIDLTERNPQAPGVHVGFGPFSFGLHDPAFNLIAGQLGTTAAPVALNSTTYSPDPNQIYGDDSIVSFGTLDGSLSVGNVCFLTVAAAAGSAGTTINGNVTMGYEAALNFTSYTTSNSGDVAAAPVTLNGQLTTGSGGSIVTVYSDDFTGSGTVDITAGAGLNVAQDSLAAPAIETVAVDFSGLGGNLNVSGLSAGYGGTISNFAAGDSIYGADNAGDPLVLGYSDNLLTVTDTITGAKQDFIFAGTYDGADFRIQSSGSIYEITYAPCFATGTLIATPAGPVAVERLAANDRVELVTGGTARVVWIGHRRQTGGSVVRIRAHALGPRSPTRDLIVSDDHGMFIGGVLVPAGLLANGETVVREPSADITFWHVELERHAILLADGAPAESYLDTGNRRQFGNCAIGYDPAAAIGDPCAEMVFAGERLDRIRSALPIPA